MLQTKLEISDELILQLAWISMLFFNLLSPTFKKKKHDCKRLIQAIIQTVYM